MKDKKQFEEINVSAKHLPLRIAVFALAVVVAASAIGYGVSQLGRKEPGWYTINAAAAEDALLYSNGIRFEYYMEGSSDLIKASLRLIEEQYSAALLRAYKELDPANAYPGVGGIAALNAGGKVECSPGLYAVLKDAYSKTLEKQGYNMFAGAYYAEWNAIIYSNDPLAYDPALDPDEKARLDAISDAVNDLGNFTLTFDDAERSAVLTVSDEYAAVAAELELEAGPVDLNLLHDAYLCAAIRDELEGEDWHRGYLAAESGVGVYFSQFDGGEISVYGEKDEIASLTVAAGQSLSEFSAYGYYEAAGELRSPYFTAEGSFGAPLAVVITVDDGGDPVECAYNNIRMLASGAPVKGSLAVLYAERGDKTLKTP